MSTSPLTLSEGLRQLRGFFNRYREKPTVMPPEDARVFQRCCDLMIERAKKLEQQPAGIDTSLLLQEIQRPGSNVALFPVVPRPIQGKRMPEGAA